MATIDIPLPAELTRLLTPPKCLDLKLPKPGKTELKLPTGGTIKPIPDITKGIPTDCGMNFNLALQIAPIMASMECLLKILKLVSAVKGALEKAADPLKIPQAIKDVLDAIGEVMPCVTMVMIPPANMIPFVQSLLRMLARMLRCTAQALRSAIEIMDGIGLDLKTAQEDGNDALAQQLECARENAQLAMEGAMVSLEPVMVLLEVAKPFIDIAQLPVEVPQIASDGTLDGMKSALEGIETFAQVLEDIAGA